MNLDRIRNSPALLRVLPFVVFLGLTWCQGQFGEGSRYWLYLFKTIAGAAMLVAIWPWVKELEWRFSLEALGAGVGVFVLWVGLDGLYPTLDELVQDYLCPVLRQIGLESWCPEPSDERTPWNPHTLYGLDSAMAWLFIVVRIAGSSIVVPPMEEMFYRSFLYRYAARPDFQNVPLGEFRLLPFLITSLLFGLAHYEWLAGILCGLIYQGLVCWKGRLGDAVAAHAITNFLLGLWVVWKGAWNFW